MTLVQLLNQPMPEGTSRWKSLIYEVDITYRKCSSVVLVQRMMKQITNQSPPFSLDDVRNYFKHTFTG